jgi:preprotein translocase subunit SecG
LGAWETAAAMELIVLSIHLLVCICLIGLVLLQRSEGGALGMGGGGGSSLMTGRGAADALAKMTSVAGGFFLVTSLGLTMLSGAGDANAGRSVLDLIPEQSAPVTPAAPAPAAPQTTPEEARPDPTESRAPSNTQLVSIGPREAAASTPSSPAPSSATTRAGPIDQHATTTAATTPRQTPASTQRTVPATTQRAATTPATTQRTAAQPPATTRSTPATTQPAATQTPARTTPAPANTAVTGIDLTTDPQIGNESSDTGSVVRRERAGPDQ